MCRLCNECIIYATQQDIRSHHAKFLRDVSLLSFLLCSLFPLGVHFSAPSSSFITFVFDLPYANNYNKGRGSSTFCGLKDVLAGNSLINQGYKIMLLFYFIFLVVRELMKHGGGGGGGIYKKILGYGYNLQ